MVIILDLDIGLKPEITIPAFSKDVIGRSCQHHVTRVTRQTTPKKKSISSDHALEYNLAFTCDWYRYLCQKRKRTMPVVDITTNASLDAAKKSALASEITLAMHTVLGVGISSTHVITSEQR